MNSCLRMQNYIAMYTIMSMSVFNQKKKITLTKKENKKVKDESSLYLLTFSFGN